MADTISVDYNQMTQISNQFHSQSDVVKQVISDLQNNMQVLVSGGWEADAANAFYDTMNNEVFPGLNRLMNALTQGGTTTQSISTKIKNAENEARSMLPNV